MQGDSELNLFSKYSICEFNASFDQLEKHQYIALEDHLEIKILMFMQLNTSHTDMRANINLSMSLLRGIVQVQFKLTLANKC